MANSGAGTNPAPQASVVVMTFNRPDGLRRCLASLAAQSLDSQSFEVVVVDVSSPPMDQVLAPFRQRLQLSHQPAPNRGVAANRNLGAERARGEVLAFLDDDCIASPTWLAELVTVVQRDPNVLVGAPTVHPAPETASAAAGQVITELVDGFFNPPGEEPGFLPGLNFALNRKRFLELGGCDPRFGFLAAEDRDFIDRWQRAGGRLELNQGTQVRHEHRASLRGFVRQYFNYGRGAWHFHRLRRERADGRLWSDARLHMAWPLRLAQPMRQVEPGLRLQVLLLIAVWQLANLAGFLWQAGRGSAPRATGAAMSIPI
ncbi:MAG: glycosyltransferase [Cyanobium sp. M30B3]|nr:MAG: glycosyltransferase [Cyanobium sp. M30B3]